VVNITDTRKTTPGLRLLEKYAVRLGGGQNHRFHLGDGILIKDNHLAALYALGMSLKDIVARAKQNASQGLKVEVEVNTIQEALDAAEAGADIIMLDNMSPDEMRRIVSLVSGRVKIEASGGVTLTNVRAVAETGINLISVGALTHSSEALDISLELEPQTFK
jgi:nicotinate-nucleotide pyrophosphorylase (carboxylating)